MGSDQLSGRDPRHVLESGRSELVPFVLLLVATLLAWFGDPARLQLRYERAAIADGEWWRLLSGHLVHLGWPHLLLNIVGLMLVWLLVGARLSTRGWIVVILFVIATMDVAFWLLRPELAWYVGLSGLLHGLLAAGVVAGWHHAPKENLAIAVVLVVKLAYEQWGGPMPGSTNLSGGPVVVDSHLFGAIGGLLIALPQLIRVRRARSI